MDVFVAINDDVYLNVCFTAISLYFRLLNLEFGVRLRKKKAITNKCAVDDDGRS